MISTKEREIIVNCINKENQQDIADLTREFPFACVKVNVIK
tara:strand:- start:1311 stop:1433 length:123 start_codon:yes stop_codon:yes gene_type:complete